MNEVTIYKRRPAVELRRELAAMPEVLAVLDPVEKAVFLSSTAKTIAEYEAGELSRELAKALRFILKDIGYRSNDEGELSYIIVRLCEILKRYYDGFTIKDFRMAFEMSITGELDEFLPRNKEGQADRGHYQNFNAEYVCKILNAYKGRRAAVLKKAHDVKDRQEPQRDPRMDIYYRNKTRQGCIEAYQYYCENAMLPEMTPIAEMLYYDILSAAGLADEIVITDDEKKHILQQTLNSFAKQGRFLEMQRVKRDGTDSPDVKHRALQQSRRKRLIDAFQRMMEQGIDITNYVKFE